MKGQLYIISAPSGAGKTSLVSALIQNLSEISVCISHTTRAKRPGEHDRVNYYFVDHDEFERIAKEDGFVEHAKVFDNYYGTSVKALESQLCTGRDVLLEIDWQGARQVRKKLPESLSIFIVPPSHDELEERLKRRGEDDDATVSRRMRDAVTEISHFDEYDYLIINDDFHAALADLQSIFRANRLNTSRQSTKHSALIDKILKK